MINFHVWLYDQQWEKIKKSQSMIALQWRHNGPDGVSNHQPHDCLLNRFFSRTSKKISKLRVTGFCEGNSPVAGNVENVSIWWRHHENRDWAALFNDTARGYPVIVSVLRACHNRASKIVSNVGSAVDVASSR